MHRLFSLSFKRIAKRLAQQELNALNVAQVLQTNKIPPCGQGFLYRLPRDELKQILSIPCPTNNLEQSVSKTIIGASKALRHHAKINEQKTCNKCPFKQKCESAKQPYTELIQDSPKDLLIFWSALNGYLRPDTIYFRHWVSAYKLGDSIIAALNDLSEGGKQIQQYQRLRVFMLQQHQQIMQKKTSQTEKNEGKLLTNNCLDQKFKIIQKLTTDYSLKSKKEMNNTEVKVSSDSNDFQSDQVQQTELKKVKSKETKQKKQIKSNQTLQNLAGYQTIQKRQDINSQNKYQKPLPKKIQKKHQYESVVNDVKFQNKNPKIRVKKQQNNLQNNKMNYKSGKDQNKNYQKQQVYQQNRNKSFNVRKGDNDKFHDRKAKFNKTQIYENKQSKNQQKGFNNKYQNNASKYEEPKKQKDSFYSESFSKESNKFKYKKDEEFSGNQQIKQKTNVRKIPLVQNDIASLQSQNQEAQPRVGRNVRRRPRSTDSTLQNQ